MDQLIQGDSVPTTWTLSLHAMELQACLFLDLKDEDYHKPSIHAERNNMFDPYN